LICISCFFAKNIFFLTIVLKGFLELFHSFKRSCSNIISICLSFCLLVISFTFICCKNFASFFFFFFISFGVHVSPQAYFAYLSYVRFFNFMFLERFANCFPSLYCTLIYFILCFDLTTIYKLL
jgi:hypothetical protein